MAYLLVITPQIPDVLIIPSYAPQYCLVSLQSKQAFRKCRKRGLLRHIISMSRYLPGTAKEVLVCKLPTYP